MKKITTILIFSLCFMSYADSQSQSATDQVIVTTTNTVANYGRGFDFTPNVTINIDSIGKRVPGGTNYAWKIWEVNSQTLVHSQVSTSTTPGVYTYEQISSPVTLNAGVKYTITLYGGADGEYYYGNSTQINSNLTYHTMRYCANCYAAQPFPPSELANYHYGTPDFKFTLCNTAPNLNCPADIAVNNDAGNCTAVVNFTPPSDACGATVTQTAGLPSGSAFPLGTTTNTFEATNGFGTGSCSFTVTVTDAEAPTLDSTSLSDVEAECEVNSLDAPTATDLCDGSVTGTSDAVFPIDNDTVVVWTYEDAEGNSITQNQNVVITGLDVSVSMSGITLTANKSGATYQWIDCSDSSSVADADGQSFTPTQNGDYAVIITDGNCTDTSACESVTSVGVQENLLQSNISLYPNPNSGSFTLDLGKMISEGEVQVLDIQGRVVQSIKIENTQELEMEITQESGVYMLKVTTENGQAMIRVVKND